ncbi:MMPL family transporter [Streptomyces sp. AP-93]|uniref:MMPL family transporter n=1 Tax=Streptomyces sp. AP-93 TaxID=2929048 RepID=UPI001FAF837A|nr:MMPL family transporter [Streptomyces sp. AP-93]MCJ0873405.1 MMPL family transporter [Streptomyces sp. AP-93]
MLNSLGGFVVRTRLLVIALAAGVVLVGGLWGTRLTDSLTDGGFYPASGPSATAARHIEERFGRQDADVVVLYSATGDGKVTDPAAAVAVARSIRELVALPEVAQVASHIGPGVGGGAPEQWSEHLAEDGRSAYAVITLTGTGEKSRAEQFQAVRDGARAPGAGVGVLVGGREATLADFNRLTAEGILMAEIIATPILSLLMLFIFRGVVAAAMPLVVGLLSVLGAFTVTRLLTQVTDVSVFAVNVITIVGLGLAIDYSLFVVSRFREELSAGADVPTAVSRTMTTAGRTVLFSGSTVLLALAGLLTIPLPFLHGIAYGGGAAIAIAMLSTLVVLPAVLAVLGHRIDLLPVGPPAYRPRTGRRWSWDRAARAVMRRPAGYGLGALAVLAVLTAPFLHASFETVDERVLPSGTGSRVVAERLAADFPGGGHGRLLVMADGTPEAAASLAVRVGAMPSVASVAPVATGPDATLLRVLSSAGEQGEGTRQLVRDIRTLPGAQVTGLAAQVEDQSKAITEGLPLLALLVCGSTFLLLMAAFRSLLLPLKAILMNLVSIGASFGVLVWAYQDGHLAGLLGFTARPLEASNLVLITVLLFGLATDYEVFLLSRIREEWRRSGDATSSIAIGMQRTGGIITSSALLLIVVVATFTTGGIGFLKLIGIGMTVALVVDVTLVRMVLVPVSMRLLGGANWWFPGAGDDAPALPAARRPEPADSDRKAAAGVDVTPR